MTRIAVACLLLIALSGCGGVKQQLAEDAKVDVGDEFQAKKHAEVSAAGVATVKSWLAKSGRPQGEQIYEESGCVPYSMGVKTPEGYWIYSVAVCQSWSGALTVHELDESFCDAAARNWSDFPENAADETCAWMKSYARGEATGYYDAAWSITKVYPESEAAKQRANYEEVRKPSKPTTPTTGDEQ